MDTSLVSRDADVMSGALCFTGTRVPVQALFDCLEAGSSGWSGVKNGKLLALAATEFDAFATVDQNLPYQQNLAQLPLAVVVLRATSNDLRSLLPLVPALEQALVSLVPRTCVTVDR